MVDKVCCMAWFYITTIHLAPNYIQCRTCLCEIHVRWDVWRNMNQYIRVGKFSSLSWVAQLPVPWPSFHVTSQLVRKIWKILGLSLYYDISFEVQKKRLYFIHLDWIPKSCPWIKSMEYGLCLVGISLLSSFLC